MANYEKYLEYLKHVDDVSKETHCEEIREAIEQKEKEIAELKEKHNSEKESLRKQAQKEKADLEAEIDSLHKQAEKSQADHEDEIEALRIGAEDKEKQTIVQYEEKIKALRDKAKKENDSLIAEMKEAKEARDAYRSAAEKERKNMVEEYNAKIKALNDQIKEMTIKYANAVPVADHNKQIVELQGQHRAELAGYRSSHIQEFEMFKTKVTKGVKELNDEIARLKSQIKTKDETIYEMKHGSFFVKLKHLFTH